MIKKIIQERKQLRELLNISEKCPCNGRANKKSLEQENCKSNLLKTCLILIKTRFLLQ